MTNTASYTSGNRQEISLLVYWRVGKK